MKEKNNQNRNISKKKSENIKIQKKIQEKIKENCNFTTAANISNYLHNNNNYNSNGISMNKSNMKINISKNYKSSNLRNISHSTKCMTKIKDKIKDKNQQVIKAINKYSATKGNFSYNNNFNKKEIIKEDKIFKNRGYHNTKDIHIPKKHNFDLNNHSFNYITKLQNTNNNNNNNIKNIEPSYYHEIYIQNKNANCNNNNNKKISKIKQVDKNYISSCTENINKSNLILPFYYYVKKIDNNNFKTKIIYSEKADFFNILQNLNKIPINELASNIVSLAERKWFNELKDNLAIIDRNKSFNFESSILNEFIKGRLMIQEDFNWLLWAMSYVLQHKIILNKNILNNENENRIKNFNLDNKSNIPSYDDINKWKEGFIYNGIYFCLLDKIEDYDKVKMVKREIKSLNLLFLDYIQLLDNIQSNIEANGNKPLMVNNLIFPLLSLTEMADFYMLASVALDPSYSKISNKNINKNDEEYIYNYYNEVDLSKYDISNLIYSPFFSNLTKNNLVNLNNGKFMLINISNDLHPLLVPKYINNENGLYDSNSNNYILLKYPLITNRIIREENFFNKSSFFTYIKYFINYLISNKYITDMPSLEYEMNKFGINKCFYLFILSKIKYNNSCDIETNNNISSLIKIYILVKLLTRIDNLQFNMNNKNIDKEKDIENTDNNNEVNAGDKKSNLSNNRNNSNANYNDIDKENKSETSCGTVNVKNNSKINIKFNTEKKTKINTIYINFNKIYKKGNQTDNMNINNRGIKKISQLILYILSPKSTLIEINNNDLTEKLLYHCFKYLEKFKKISNKLFSNNVNTLYEPKSFLKSLIISARKNPLIFLRQIENKFNVLLNYEIKYCSSICLENFVKYFNVDQIVENGPKILSYINGEELGFYLIIKNISSTYQKNKSNFVTKKGSKMIKNISSENMEICSNKYNYDNISILNRSIIRPRNSNFKILNSSKDKTNLKNYNNIHKEHPSNKKAKSIYSDIDHKNKDNAALTGSNNSGITNTGTGSINTNINDNSASSNNNILVSFKNNNLKSFNNCENNDNVSSIDNFVVSSSSKDMFEFNYGDEDSEKSFNFSYGESGVQANLNKKRNTTNINNSKFNLNNNNLKNNINSNKSNINNISGNNCRTINAKNYISNNNNNNINIDIGLNNKVINNNNPYNNMTPSCSSSLINNQNKIYFCKENKNQFWHILFNNYHLKFPYNLYKVATNNKSTLLIYKYLSMYYSFFYFYNDNFSFTRTQNKGSKNPSPEINITEMLNEQEMILEKIFGEIITINPRTSYILIHFYFYYFINYYFVENNNLKECEKIISKINDIFKNKILYKQNNYNIIINILNGLLNDKINFLKTEKYCSKSLILSLIQYGEPRGRNNDGNSIMLFPVWKTGRNCMILDNNEILNENYKELFHCLFYLYDNKKTHKSNLSNMKEKLIDKSIINDLYRNIEYTKKFFKRKAKKLEDLNFNNINNQIENKSNEGSFKDYKTKNYGNLLQNYMRNQNEDTFFNMDDEDMLERPSKVNNIYDEFSNVDEVNNDSMNINSSIYVSNISNNLNLKNHMNIYNTHINSRTNSNNINNIKIIPTINSGYTFDKYFKENSTFPNVIFPSMSDKKTTYINTFFSSEKFFVYFVKSVFSLINYSQGDLTYTNDYLKEYIFSDTTIFHNNNNFISLNSPKQKNSILTKILSNNLYYKKYCQSNILISFGNNLHCETGHKGYKFLSLPRVLYHLKNKEIISIKSGWEHSIAQDKDGMIFSWGNNSCCQCGFEPNDNSNGNILFPSNIIELNNKNIIEISCGNEHTLALSNEGEVYSWGSISDGVLGREPPVDMNCPGVAKPGKINYFSKNNIKIKHISSGSIHNLCLDDKSNLYSFGCSKGGQLGLDERELSVIYKQNQNNIYNKLKTKDIIKEIEKENNYCVIEPQLIKDLKDVEIVDFSAGEAHNVAISSEGKCFVWGFGSNGQLGLGFCEDQFPPGEGMQKTRIFTPTLVNEFEIKNNKISKVYCGKTFTIFVNEKDELYSTGINDLNQCGIDNNLIANDLCNDIVTPIKIEMFMRMKIINISCGESHVLAITEDNCIKTLFSWGSNRFGQLGQGIQTKKCMPKIVNYFLHYNNSEVIQVSCGAFHSLALLKRKNDQNINTFLDEQYIFECIDRY